MRVQPARAGPGECHECGFGFNRQALRLLRRGRLLAPLSEWRSRWLVILAVNCGFVMVFFGSAERTDRLLGMRADVFYLALSALLMMPWRFRRTIEASLLEDSNGVWLVRWGLGLTALHGLAIFVWLVSPR